jgi:F-type H+-transporting ATPase subunit gamma
MDQFIKGELDAVYVVYMNFVSTGVQRPEVMTLLPLASVDQAAPTVAKGGSSAAAPAKPEARRTSETSAEGSHKVVYEFSPSAKELLDELLPLTVKSALFQAMLDATTSEHVARMVAMKSATDNADKMAKALTMKYNRARQSQITTELSEIMGGVEAMKG